MDNFKMHEEAEALTAKFTSYQLAKLFLMEREKVNALRACLQDLLEPSNNQGYNQ